MREGHRIRGLKTIGIDEVSYHKGHKYATLVYDLDRSCVVWIGQGKGRETIDRFFNEALSDYQKARIQSACCDMSQAYIGAIETHCPNATLVLDRFHIVKSLNEAVDEVRKEQWREATEADRKALKGLRWLLYRHSSTRTREDTRNLKALDKHNRRIYRAWRLKEEFEHFWDYKATWAAERFLKHWTKSALLSRWSPCASSSTPCASINRPSLPSSIPGSPMPLPKGSIASSGWSTTGPVATAISMHSPT